MTLAPSGVEDAAKRNENLEFGCYSSFWRLQSRDRGRRGRRRMRRMKARVRRAAAGSFFSGESDERTRTKISPVKFMSLYRGGGPSSVRKEEISKERDRWDHTRNTLHF